MNTKRDDCQMSRRNSRYGVPALAGYAHKFAPTAEISCALEVSDTQPAKAWTPYLWGFHSPVVTRHPSLVTRPSPT